jgi:DNA-binding NarL/FixJ family response regulator
VSETTSNGNDEPLRVLVVAYRRPSAESLPPEVAAHMSMRLIARTEDVEHAVDDFQPHVALIDTTFPDGEGYTTIERLLVHAPHVPVLALTPSPAPHDQVLLAIRAGAVGYVETDTEPDGVLAAVRAVLAGDTWFPQDDMRRILTAAADELDTSPAERRSRLTGVILALVPLTGLIAAMETGFWRRYMGAIGVRPVDLAVDPASRVIDLIVTLLYFLGIFGPLLFVGTWLDMLEDSRWNRGFVARVLRHRVWAHLLVSLAWILLAALLTVGPDLALIVVSGPVVALSILAKAVGASDELPRFMRIEGISLPAAIAGTLVFTFAFMGVLAWEVIVVGPDLRTDGEHGYIAPRVLGLNAIPVRAYNVNTGDVSEVLYLGGNADLYVLVDVCDDRRVDYVSVGAHRLVIIDEITCPADAGG